MNTSTADIAYALQGVFAGEIEKGKASVTILAGQLGRLCGVYPLPDGTHRMPMVCQAMWNEYSEEKGDRILNQQAKGKGSKLEIEYKLPR